MNVCSRCHRPLKHASPTGMGPTCSRLANAQAPQVHERDLFGFDVGKACAAALEAVAVAIAAAGARERMAIRKDYLERMELRRQRQACWSAV